MLKEDWLKNIDMLLNQNARSSNM